MKIQNIATLILFFLVQVVISNGNPQNEEFYIPCNTETQDNLQQKYTFVPNITHFELQNQNFTSIESGLNILVNLVYIEENFEENKLKCDLQGIKVVFQNPVQQYQIDLIIKPLAISFSSGQYQQLENSESNNSNIGNLEQFIIQGVKNVQIESISVKEKLFQGQQVFVFQSIQNLIIDRFSFNNLTLEGVDLPVFEIQDVSNVNIKNSNMTNIRNNDSKIAGIFFLKDCEDVIVLDCNFQDNYSLQNSGIFKVQNSQNFKINNSEFSNNEISQGVGTVGVLEQIQQVLVDQSLFFNNQGAQQGSVFQLENVENTNIKGSTFKQNKSKNQGGCFYILSNQLTNNEMVIENSNFEQNESVNGGVMYLLDLKKLLLKQSNFSQNSAKESEGVLIQGYNPEFVSESCNFTSNNAYLGKGGALALQNLLNPDKEYSIFINSTIFLNNKAKDGGAISILQLEKTNNQKNKIQFCLFQQNNAMKGKGGAIFIDNVEGQLIFANNNYVLNYASVTGGGISTLHTENLIIKDSNFEFNMVHVSGAGLNFESHSEHIELENLVFKKGLSMQEASAFKIQDCELINVKNIQILDSLSERFTAGFQLLDSKHLRLENFVMKGNVAQSYGAFSVDLCDDVVLQNFTVFNNTAFNQIGVMMILQSENVQLMDFMIRNNSANIDKAGILIQLSSQILIQDSLIQDNYAKNSRGGVSIEMCNSIELNRVQILNNIVNDGSAGVYALSSKKIKIQGCLIQGNKNQGKQGGAMLFLKNYNVSLSNCTFRDNYVNENGGGIQFLQSDIVLLSDVVFEGNQASRQGGALMFIDSKEIKVYNGLFEDNLAGGEGGAIQIVQVQNFTVNQTKFMKNKAQKGHGGGISIGKKSDFIQIENVNFSENQGLFNGGGISVQDIGNITIVDCRFSQNFAGEKGGGVYVQKGEFLYIDKIEIQNHNETGKGGGMYAEDLKEMKVLESKFVKNQAKLQGGGIWMRNIEEILIQKVQIYLNFVLGSSNNAMGGGIYLEKSQKFQFFECEIENSYAFFKGGAIYLKDVVSSDIESSYFRNNSVYYDRNSEKNTQYPLTQGGCLYYEPELLQGKQTPKFKFYSGQIISSQASSGGGIFISLQSEQNIEMEIKKAKFQNNSADLGGNIRILSEISQENLLKQIQNIESKNATSYLSKENIFFGYYYNEKLIKKGKSQYVLCPQGQYLEQGGQIQCNKCLKNAICPGGYMQIYPEKNFWRDSKKSYQFYYCENNPEACLGNDTCREGHMGLFCEKCDRVNRYSLDSRSNSCLKCDVNDLRIVLSICLLFFMVVLFLFNQIYGVSLRIRKNLYYKVFLRIFGLHFEKVQQLSASTKIVIMHFQIINIVLSNNFEIFKVIKDPINVIASPNEGFAKNLECLIDIENEEDLKKEIDYFLAIYGLLILMGTLFFMILVQFVCFLVKKYILMKSQLFQYIQCSILCFFVFVQPALFQNALEYLKGREVNGVEYCAANTNIRMDDDFYLLSVFPMKMAIAIFSGFVFPVALIVILVVGRKKGMLKSVSFQRKFGILYLEYTQKNYCWELIVILLKNIIVVLTNLLENQQFFKIICIILILFAYMIVCFKIWPYKTQQINKQAIISCVISIVTIGFIESYQMQSENEIVKYVLDILIFSANIFFIIYSGLIMGNDFIYQIRGYLISYCVFSKFLQKKCIIQANKEFQAKVNWKNVIIRIRKGQKMKKTNPVYEKWTLLDILVDIQDERNSIQEEEIIQYQQQQQFEGYLQNQSQVQLEQYQQLLENSSRVRKEKRKLRVLEQQVNSNESLQSTRERLKSINKKSLYFMENSGFNHYISSQPNSPILSPRVRNGSSKASNMLKLSIQYSKKQNMNEDSQHPRQQLQDFDNIQNASTYNNNNNNNNFGVNLSCLSERCDQTYEITISKSQQIMENSASPFGDRSSRQLVATPLGDTNQDIVFS